MTLPQPQAAASYIAEQGVLDLKSWDADHDGAVRLDGEWALDWQQYTNPALSSGAEVNCESCNTGYVQVPGIWKSGAAAPLGIQDSGYATYRLTIQTAATDGLYGLYLKSIHSAYRLYINGTLVSSVGEAGASPASTTGHYGRPVVLFHHQGTELELMLQVANYSFPTGGIDKSILFGTQEQITTLRQQGLARDLFLFGAMFTIAIYHMVLYVLRRHNWSTLYFSLFCFMMAARTLAVNERFILMLFTDMTQEIFVKISYVTVYLGLPLLILFIYSLYPSYYSLRIVRAVCAISGVLSLLILLTPVRIYHFTLLYYQVLILVVLIYILARLGVAALQKEAGTTLLLIAFANLFVFALNDVLYNNNLTQFGTLVPFGMFVFILLQSLLLSINFSKAFTRIEQLSDRLLQLDRSKDQFLHNTSHELKTPLQGMIGLAESLAAGAAGPLPAEAVRQLRLIQSSGQRLSHLVHDLQDFTRLQDKEIVLQPTVLHMHQAAELVIRLLKPLAEGKTVAFNNQIPADVLVYADENRVLQIMSNLIGNALKFTDAGSITLEASTLGQWQCITVRDTGIGIPHDRQEAIFEAFEQGDGSITRLYGGTGIGLSITRHLVELHGGRIWVRSTEGEGAAFSFTLPLHDPSCQAMPMDAETRTDVKTQLYKSSGLALAELHQQLESMPTPYLEGMREEENTEGQRGEGHESPCILIVDDDPIILQILHNHLSSAGYIVVQASSGQEALEQLTEGCEPSLIITDLMMPRMSGYELCRVLRDQYGERIPILILTARNQSEDIELGFDAGTTDYLIKPITRAELLSRVELHLKLATWNHSLEKEVIKRTVQMRQTMKETAVAIADISAEEERKRITKEIHDALGYSLTTTLLQLEAGKSLIPSKPEEALKYMSNSQELVRRGLSSIRRSLRQLKEHGDEQQQQHEREQGRSFAERIQHLIQETEAYTGIQVQYELQVDEASLSPEQQKVLYDALQEGITNGIRHGHSRAFQLQLLEQDDWIEFRLRNTGHPYAPEQPGIGLSSMKEAVHRLGGQVTIGSDEGKGCLITIHLKKERD